MNEKQKEKIKLDLFIEKVEKIKNSMQELLNVLYINDDTLNTMYNDKVDDLPFEDDFELVVNSWSIYLEDLQALKENDIKISNGEKIKFLIDLLNNNEWEYEITNDMKLYFIYDNDELMVDMITHEVIFSIHGNLHFTIDELIIDLLNR